MKKIITLTALLATMATGTARANDNAAYAIGGFILGVIASNNHNDRPPPPPPPPQQTLYRAPKISKADVVPVYQNVCRETVEYDINGYQVNSRRVCSYEIVGYKTVYTTNFQD